MYRRSAVKSDRTENIMTKSYCVHCDYYKRVTSQPKQVFLLPYESYAKLAVYYGRAYLCFYDHLNNRPNNEHYGRKLNRWINRLLWELDKGGNKKVIWNDGITINPTKRTDDMYFIQKTMPVPYCRESKRRRRKTMGRRIHKNKLDPTPEIWRTTRNAAGPSERPNELQDDEERYSHGDEQRRTEPKNPRKKRRIAGASELEHCEGETLDWPIWL